MSTDAHPTGPTTESAKVSRLDALADQIAADALDATDDMPDGEPAALNTHQNGE